ALRSSCLTVMSSPCSWVRMVWKRSSACRSSVSMVSPFLYVLTISYSVVACNPHRPQTLIHRIVHNLGGLIQQTMMDERARVFEFHDGRPQAATGLPRSAPVGS